MAVVTVVAVVGGGKAGVHRTMLSLPVSGRPDYVWTALFKIFRII